MSEVLCKNCRWFVGTHFIGDWLHYDGGCYNPSLNGLSPVDGSPKRGEPRKLNAGLNCSAWEAKRPPSNEPYERLRVTQFPWLGAFFAVSLLVVALFVAL